MTPTKRDPDAEEKPSNEPSEQEPEETPAPKERKRAPREPAERPAKPRLKTSSGSPSRSAAKPVVPKVPVIHNTWLPGKGESFREFGTRIFGNRQGRKSTDQKAEPKEEPTE